MTRLAKVVAALLALLAGALAVRHGLALRIKDFDELWHLATGRLIVETGSVPSRDPFTFTAGEAPWVNTNWLSQALLYGLWRAGGFEACGLLGLALFFASLALVHRTALGRTRSAWAAVPVLAFAWQALATGSTIRPQGWTFALLAAAAPLLEALRERPTPPRTAALGALLALLVQLHGGAVFAFVFVAAALLDEARRHVAAALALGAAGFLVHPHGVESLVHPIRYALDPGVLGIRAGTSELQPPDLGSGVGRLLEVPLLVFIGAALVGRPRLRASDLAALAVFLHLALTTRRGLHYFAIVSAGPAAATLDAALDVLRERGGRVARTAELVDSMEPALRRASRSLPLVFAGAVLLVALCHADRIRPGTPRALDDSPLLETQNDIAEVASWIRTANPKDEVWNELETGGALIWALWPERRVYIDGRGDFHGRAGTYDEMARVFEGRDGWEAILERRRCATVVVNQAAPLATKLHRRGWERVLSKEGRGAEKRLLGVYVKRP